jgi:hypothetical protein
MRKVLYVLFGFQLIVSGCAEHISAHCWAASHEIATPPEMRVNYSPILTPIFDATSECYCSFEDFIIIFFTITSDMYF